MARSELQRIILFDGVCNLCNSTVDFVRAHNKNNSFKFVPVQSDEAQKILAELKYQTAPTSSVIFIAGNQLYFKSTAALKIAKYLDRPFRYAYVLILIPPFIRDAVYAWIASHRYKWFGKKT